jgi:hypothetical protein
MDSAKRVIWVSVSTSGDPRKAALDKIGEQGWFDTEVVEVEQVSDDAYRVKIKGNVHHTAVITGGPNE